MIAFDRFCVNPIHPTGVRTPRSGTRCSPGSSGRPLAEDLGGLAKSSLADATGTDKSSRVPVYASLPDEQLALIGCGVTTELEDVHTAAVITGSSGVVVGCGGAA